MILVKIRVMIWTNVAQAANKKQKNKVLQNNNIIILFLIFIKQKMPEDKLEKIDNIEVLKLSLLKFKGEKFLIENINQFNNIIPLLAIENFFGFDTETRPSFKKGRNNQVSLLQLATPEKAFMFRINKIGLPPGLIKILSDVTKLKIGLAVKDDIIQLQRIEHFKANGFIDLQNLAGINGIGELGLRKMAAIVLKGRISKSEQLSNWEKPKLTEKQQNYAAIDAWACLEIYRKLQSK